MSNRYKERRPVAVGISGGTARYGWLTNLLTADSSDLGHEELGEDGSGGTGVIFFGAARPKPPRARKISDGVSSFYDASTGASAMPPGWVKVSPSKSFPIAKSSPKSKLVYVSISSGKYAWNMPIETYTSVGAAKEGLGIKDVAAADKCFLGVNTITNTDVGKLGKPPRAWKEISGTDGVDRISTWCEYPVPTNLPAGWAVS